MVQHVIEKMLTFAKNIHFRTTHVKKFFIIMAVLTLVITANATPAKRGLWRTLTLTDGTAVLAQLSGDEFAHFWQSVDGRCFVEQEDGTYALADMNQLRATSRSMHMKRAQRHARRAPLHTQIGHEHAPIVGTKKGIIILVEYTNSQFAEGHDQVLYDRIANEEGFNDGRFSGSVHDYFYDQSNGQFDLTFDVVGPVQMDTTYQYYGQDVGGRSGYDRRPGEMVATACQMVDDIVDFNDYDWDGDGVVDQVFVLYAGRGQADGGNSSTIWPHEWELSSSDYGSTLILDDCAIDTYACGNEVSYSGGINGIGTICHEFSHCLGFPDLYDIDYGGNYGMGNWDMMDGGCYNNDGFHPSGYSAYEKWVAGWIELEELGSESVSITGMKPQSAHGEAYMIRNPSWDDEYYILENRDRNGWDKYNPGSGMLIHHVDYNSDLWSNNIVNTTTGEYAAYNDHQRCTIFMANNNKSDEHGHPYPYGSNNTLSDESMPKAFWYNADDEGSTDFHDAIDGIKLEEDGTISFSYVSGREVIEVITSEDDLLFCETFDKCEGIGGNDNRWSGNAGKGVFRSDYRGWLGKNKFGANQCVKIGIESSQGSITSPEMLAEGVYELTFKSAPWMTTWQQMVVSVLNENGKEIVKETYPVMDRKQWSEYKLQFESDGVVRLHFATTRFQFFLDDVKVVRISGPSAISEVKADREDGTWHMLDGRTLSARPTKAGVYVVDGKKVIVK